MQSLSQKSLPELARFRDNEPKDNRDSRTMSGDAESTWTFRTDGVSMTEGAELTTKKRPSGYKAVEALAGSKWYLPPHKSKSFCRGRALLPSASVLSLRAIPHFGVSSLSSLDICSCCLLLFLKARQFLPPYCRFLGLNVSGHVLSAAVLGALAGSGLHR